MGGQLYELPFSSGMDDATDPRRSVKMLSLTNYRWTKRGRIEKRFGWAPASITLAAGGSLPSTAKLLEAGPNSALLYADGASVYGLTSVGWGLVGPLVAVKVRTTATTLIGAMESRVGPVQAADWDVALSGGLYVYTYQLGSSVYVYITDPSGAIVLPATALTNMGAVNGNPFRPKLIANGTTCYVLTNKSQCFISIIDTSVSPPTVSPGISLGTATTSTANVYDVAWNASSSQIVLATIKGGGGTVTVNSYSSALLLQHTYSGASLGVGGVSAIGVSAGAGGNVYLAYSNTAAGTTTISGDSLTSTLVSINGAVATIYSEPQATMDVCNYVATIESSGTQYHVVFSSVDVLNAISTEQTRAVCVNTSNDNPINSSITKCATLVSRPWMVGTSVHALVLSRLSQGYVTLDVTGVGANVAAAVHAPPLTVVNPRTACGSGLVAYGSVTVRTPSTLCSVVSPAAGVRESVVTEIASNDTIAAVSVTLQRATFDYGWGMNPSAPLPSGQTTPTGIVTTVENGATVEAGFLARPVIQSVTFAGAGGNLSAGSYLWIAVYRRVAPDGSAVYSQPSAPVGGTAVNSDRATLVVSQSTLTLQTPSSAFATPGQTTYLDIYRTQVNGKTYTRASSDPAYNASPNNPNASNASYGDGAADTSIAPNPQLYTQGGSFDNVQPPSCTIAARVRDRVWLAGSPDGQTVYYSDTVGRIGDANYHDEQQIVLDVGGEFTGVAALDEKTILFKAEKIFVVYGDAGPPTGTGNTLSSPQEIHSGGVGCVSARSIVETPFGLMFQSQRGIELLDRALTVQFVGEAVKDETNLATVTGAQLVPTQYQIRFFLGTTNQVLVFCTQNSEWSVYSYAQPGRTVDAATFGDVVYWVTDTGAILAETPNAYSDNGSWIVSSGQVQHVNLGSLEGFRRVIKTMLLGQYFSPSGITLQFFADYALTSFQTESFTDTLIASDPAFDSNRVQIGVRQAIQKVEALSVSFADSAPVAGGTGKGMALNAIAFEVVPKPGAFKKLSSQVSR